MPEKPWLSSIEREMYFALGDDRIDCSGKSQPSRKRQELNPPIASSPLLCFPALRVNSERPGMTSSTTGSGQERDQEIAAPSANLGAAANDTLRGKGHQEGVTTPASSKVQTTSAQSQSQFHSGPRPWLPDTLSGWITMAVALASLLLGIYNAYIANRKDRTLLKVSLEKPAVDTGCWMAKIVNLSRHTVHVEQIFIEDSEGRQHIIPHIVKDPGDISKPRLPFALQQGESTIYGINNSFLASNLATSCELVAVKTSTDKWFKSKRMPGGIKPFFVLSHMPGFDDQA
jgi:hypothetical protein